MVRLVARVEKERERWREHGGRMLKTQLITVSYLQVWRRIKETSQILRITLKFYLKFFIAQSAVELW
jgi:hypothetical protein